MHRQPKESIQVTIRIRPLCQRQLQSTSDQDLKLCIKQALDTSSQKLILFNGIDTTNPKSFAFDQIITSEENQEAVFERVGKNSIVKCLEGYNCSIFAYGQTGAGKTFTMMGVGSESSKSYEKRGLIPRTLEYLFGSVDKEMVEEKTEYLIVCRFLEIYNENIIDLLDKNNKNLQLREDLKKGVYVQGLSECIVTRAEEALELLRKGSKGRHVGSTFYNDNSSRSHSVYTLQIQSKSVKNSVTNIKQRSFHFIDLAGSERTKLLQDERLKEGCSINKSLHVLGMVINSLVESTENKYKHIGYRDSKLTFLLKDSLGGNSKTHLIANISPSINSYSETLSTLSFARRVKLIKVDKASINEDTTGSLQTLKLQIVRLKQQLIEFKSNNVGSHFVSMQSLDHDSSQITQLAIKNEGQIELEKLFKEYVDEAIEKETKMEVEVLRCVERLKILEEGIAKGEFEGGVGMNGIHNEVVLAQSLRYNRDFLKKLSHLLSLNITDRQSITHILQTHPNNTYTLPFHQSPLKNSQQTQYMEKYEQLSLQTEMLRETIRENQIMLAMYEEGEENHRMKIEEIVEEHTRTLEEIREKCGGQLGEMEKYEEQMEININRMTLELLELKQELIVKQNQLIESRSRNKVLSEQLLQSSSKLQSSTISQLQTLTKLNQLKPQLTSKDTQIQNLKRQLEQAISIVNNVEIQFQQQKTNNSSRYNEIIKTNQQTIWQLQKQINKYKLEQVTYEKEKELNYKRSQEFYEDILEKQTTITELKEELDDMSHKLELERNINKNQLSVNRSIQQQSIEARYQQLLCEKRNQVSSLEEEMEELKMVNVNVSNELKLKGNIEVILNSRLESQIVRNREIEEELYQLKEKVLESEEKEIRQNREVESLKRKEGAIVEQLNNVLKEKAELQQGGKTLQIKCQFNEEEILELKQKLERKEAQLERVKQSNIRELQSAREEIDDFRRRAQENQEYFRQLFQEGNTNKQKILNDTKKHLLETESLLSHQRHNLSLKSSEICKLNLKVQSLQSFLQQSSTAILQKQSQIDELKQQLTSQQSRFLTKLQQRQHCFNEFNERKSQEIEELEEKVGRLMQILKQQDEQKMTVIEEEYEIMKQNHQELLNDYSIDIKQKHKQINSKQQTILKLRQEVEEKAQTIKQLEHQINKLNKNEGLGSVMTFKDNNSSDTKFKYFELQQEHNNSLLTVDNLNKKLLQAGEIINSLDSDNHQLITQVNGLRQELREMGEETDSLMREKELISSDLNDKLEEIEKMKRRWEVKRKDELEGIEGQFKEYKEETQKMNGKLMRNYEVLREEQEKYKELVERYEEVIQWNEKLVEENNELREELEGKELKESKYQIGNERIVRQSVMESQVIEGGGLDVIEEEDSRQVNRTTDVTANQLLVEQTQSQNNSYSEDIVNTTNQGQQQSHQYNYNELLSSHQHLTKEFSSLQQTYQQLQQQYLRSSQHWQQQKHQLTHALSSLQQQLQQHQYRSKPRSTLPSFHNPSIKKHRYSVNYQQEISLKLELEKRGSELGELTGGVLEICHLLNIKGLNHGNTRFKIETIKASIENMMGQISGYKRDMRDKEKEIEMRNVRAEIREREFNRVKGSGGVKGGDGKSLRGVEEMRNQKSILQQLHKRMKGQGQENRNNTNRM